MGLDLYMGLGYGPSPKLKLPFIPIPIPIPASTLAFQIPPRIPTTLQFATPLFDGLNHTDSTISMNQMKQIQTQMIVTGLISDGLAPSRVIAHVIHLGFDSDVYVNNAVIHLLVSCGDLDDAHKVFDESSQRDLASWKSIINGYVRSGRPCMGGLEIARADGARWD
ncbi:hypothetical protein OSB04_un000756 [Centaurea solstitialis]|uniref:Pentatricopeptide repeat-containing protein n=1 Tax=Centaurea solstitialis TaxID=347529 RepID=A0AA38SHD3_9ASTR|nr:hypothetical protein OSB04_un000756 [Centaurea solstitialis]